MPDRSDQYRNRGRRAGLSKSAFETYSRERWAWLRVTTGQFIAWVENKKVNGVETDEIEAITLYVGTGKRQPTPLTLSSCTEEELVAIRSFLNEIIDWAMPIVQKLDKEASDALERGDDSHARNYRQIPQVVFRERPKSEHSEGVHDRPEDATSSSLDDVDSERNVREPESGLAERDQARVSSEDNGKETDESPSIRPMGAVADRSQRVPPTVSVPNYPSPNS